MSSTAERRQQIIEYLNGNRSTTLEELTVLFQVSKRTIRYDLEILSCSYPLYTVQGKGGGIRVADGWYLSRSYLSDKQEALLRDLMSGLQPQDRETMNAILAKFAKPEKEK